MCNLYANRTAQAEMRRMFRVAADRDRLGNWQAQGAIWPKQEAAVVRLDADGACELVPMRWGFLTPQVSKRTGEPIQPAAWHNARDDRLAEAALWRDSFRTRRCLIPATSFRETKGRAPAIDVWFALTGTGDRPPFAFAGLWRTGQPGVPGEAGDWTAFTMITTPCNDLVRPVQPNRMPAILDPADYETWLSDNPRAAGAVLRPWPEAQMRVVREGVGIGGDGDEGETPAPPPAPAVAPAPAPPPARPVQASLFDGL